MLDWNVIRGRMFWMIWQDLDFLVLVYFVSWFPVVFSVLVLPHSLHIIYAESRPHCPEKQCTTGTIYITFVDSSYFQLCVACHCILQECIQIMLRGFVILLFHVTCPTRKDNNYVAIVSCSWVFLTQEQLPVTFLEKVRHMKLWDMWGILGGMDVGREREIRKHKWKEMKRVKQNWMVRENTKMVSSRCVCLHYITNRNSVYTSTLSPLAAALTPFPRRSEEGTRTSVL